MLRHLLRLVTLGGASILFILLAPLGNIAPLYAQSLTLSSANISVFATGLDNPRGLTFGPDGNLYVAEGGQGGLNSTVGLCPQAPPPVGPNTGGMTARISKISPSGRRTTVVDHLPSSQTSPTFGSQITGVADVRFIDNTLYGLLAGGGCSNGNKDKPNAIIRVDPAEHKVAYIANLSQFFMTHPVAHPNPADFDPDGVPYSMITVGTTLYLIEANHGELDKVKPNGAISRIVDISATQGHIVPTALAFHEGNFYVGNIDGEAPGAANIYKITPDGQISLLFSGLTEVLGIAFDPCGRLYALESYTGNQLYAPGTGTIVRWTTAGNMETVASGLTTATAMAFGPDGKIYVSNNGFNFQPGQGQIVRVDTNVNSCN